MRALAKVFQFPTPAQGSSVGATWSVVLRSRARETLGRLLNKLGAPGAVSDAMFRDSLTGQEVEIHVGVLSTRITINGRDYYFDRVTGKPSGAGTAR